MGVEPNSNFRIVFSPRFDRIMKQLARKDSVLHERVDEQLLKIAREPAFGKPLRHALKNQRRLHVGSFVLTYEIIGNQVHILNLEHHDDAYKK
jgi:mRNA-degrading endonuclease RelE of RelBE toxin-antitoxin system